MPAPVLASPRLPLCLARLVGEGDPPVLARLAGVGGGGLDPRFLPQRERAALARWDRESWHREAARGGVREYAEACAARRRGLYAERREVLDGLRTTAHGMGARLMTDPAGDVAAAAAAQERLRLATLGWAARLRAEDHVEERTRAALAMVGGHPAPRLRTALDGLDVLAGGLPPTKEEVLAAGVQERARARQEAA